MTRFAILLLALAVIAIGCNKVSAAGPDDTNAAETKYLAFQLMTGIAGYSGPQPAPGHFALGKAPLESFVREVVKAIGTTGDARHKLGFTVGPLCFDMSDRETRQFIRDSFAVARENDVAVAFHIDDSMCWGERRDLLSNSDNIETADWKQEPSTGRRADWGPSPTRFPPQMCFNSPAVVAAVKERGGLIGAEIKQELAALRSQGKAHLFAGVIAGWETQIGRDFETDRSLGYRALSHRGFSESNPPKDPDLERVHIVREFMELWANSLRAGGIPRDKVFCHIAFTDQGLRKADAKQSYAVKVHFAVPEVAFSSAYRPGFSTYPEGTTFKEVHAILAKHGSPGWISAEGTNVSPTSMPGEPTMETYLGRMFNHGAVMVNVFAWGIGGESMRNNFFRRATENPEALAAYAKFLRQDPLIETAPTGFSSEAFQAKMRRLQEALPGWVQKSGRHAQVMPLTKRLDALIKGKKWQEADKVADELLALMKGDKPKEAKSETSALLERLPRKIQRIQKELPAWIRQTGKTKEASALMKKLEERLNGKNFEDAEKTADSILKMLGKPLDPGEGQDRRLDPPSPFKGFGPRNGRIALTLRDPSGELQIFSIQPDGSGKKQLTTRGDNGRPDWSPDGRKIAFMSIRDGERPAIRVMNADGTGQRFLSEGLTPDWSPDGTKIAYASFDSQIHVMDADGSNSRQITKSDTPKAGPSWSPDGRQMVFILLKSPGAKTDFQPVIGIMNADGTNERILTRQDRTNIKSNPGGAPTVLGTAKDANAPSWSPAGDKVAFWSGIEGAYGQVWSMNTDGTGSRQLTDAPKGTNNDDPSWSPDGKWILFGTNRSGKNELWVMDADGNNQARVSDLDAAPFPGRASWQPIRPTKLLTDDERAAAEDPPLFAPVKPEGDRAQLAPDQDISEEIRRQIQETLGAPFVVFRDKVRDDLKFSDEQKKALDAELQARHQDAMRLFQKINDLKPKDREKELDGYRPKAQEQLTAFLKKTLKTDQLKRLRQIELQQEGSLAVGQPEIANELKITDEQRMQFAVVVQSMQKSIEPLIKEAQTSGKHEEIRPKAMKIRKEHEQEIVAILDDTQKKQWKEMLGKPLDLGDNQGRRLDPNTPFAGRIALAQRDADSVSQIVVAEKDGRNRRVITKGPQPSWFPAWSPDGERLLFVREIQRRQQLWIMNADGGEERALVESDGQCIAGSWSPDGKQIAYARSAGGEPQGLKIWIAEADGSKARRLTTAKGKTIDENVPRWSPDGKRIAFTSNQREGRYAIWVAEVATGKTEVLTKAYHDMELNADVEQKVPAWSPDGKWIAYWCGVEMTDPRPNVPRHVWVMCADGTGQKRLVGGDDPNWSPTGEFIIHSTHIDFKPALGIVRPDGTDAKILFFVDANRPLQSSWVDRK